MYLNNFMHTSSIDKLKNIKIVFNGLTSHFMHIGMALSQTIDIFITNTRTINLFEIIIF